MLKKRLLDNISFLALLTLVVVVNCGDVKDTKRSPRIRKLSKVLSPKNGSKIRTGEQIDFSVVPSQDTIKIDSFIVRLGLELAYSSNQIEFQNPVPSKTGKQSLSYTVFMSNGKKEQHSQSITFLSDVEPLKYTYRKVNSYTHDPDAYVQGLFFENGFFYESTGHRGESTLRKVEVTTGNVLQKIDIEQEFFSEGITPIGDQIFMLTWESRKGFVFNKTDFSKVREFEYPTQGWGITTIGDSLVMSDGSENLYFISPDTFTEIGRIQIYDENAAIEGLNELEYINGDIYANIYQTDNIAIIDPKSGKVKGVIDLAGIFNKENYGRRADVLNGIAYDQQTDRLFVTGKYWPKLYEIELVLLDQPTI